MSDETKTLYERLGGYDAITAVVNDLLPRLQADPQLGRFWAHREEDSARREKQLPCESRHPISQTLPDQLAIRPPLRRRA